MGHKCQKWELSVLLTQEEGIVEEEFVSIESQGEEEQGHDDHVQPEISLKSLVGITSPKTFKLQGELHGVPVVVMIDPGTTHNFIMLWTMKELDVSSNSSK